MATFTVTFQVGDVIQTLELVQASARDPSPFMSDVLLLMIRSTQLTFQAQGRPDRWNDLAESTVKARFRRAARGRGAAAFGSLGILGSIRILQDRGNLLQSVGGGASGPFSTSDGFGESDEFSAVIGTNHPGWRNQFPDTRGWRDARLFLLWQDQDEEDVAAMGMDWFLRVGPYAA